MKTTFNLQPSTTNLQGVSSNRRSFGVGRGQVEGSRSARERGTPHREQGIALIITLIMLAITLVMAVAFLALARRERNSVTTTTDTTTARLAADSAVAAAQAQIVANHLLNAYNLHLLVSTNYINPFGFNPAAGGNPTNVNYLDVNGNLLAGLNLEQNISNLFYLPRAPVFVPTNLTTQTLPGYDFRYYLDLNQNGRFEPNGVVPNVVNAAGVLVTNGLVNVVGDPEWIGVLEHPDAPHGPNNHFIARYAFIAVPAGNTLDLNYIHNQARNNGVVTLTTPDSYTRNQGVGSWEINLAAFLADLNTNIWAPVLLPDNLYYAYNEPGGFNNSGIAFDDARALTAYRYNKNPLPSAINVLFRAFNTFPSDGIDDYSRGPLQTNLDYNRAVLLPTVSTSLPWSGANNTNHFFTPSDFLDPTKSSSNFTNRLRRAGNGGDTYDRYTYYRMLDELGSDSSADAGKLNLNYSNAVVTYNLNQTPVTVAGISIVPGAETNLVRWRPVDFFHAAADQLLRTYTTNWYNANYFSFTNTYAVTAPFGITSIPVWVSNRFVYTPAVHRLLQLAANLYDATTNGNYNLPHVFRPIFERRNNVNGDVFIVGYTPVTYVLGMTDPQLAPPYDVTQLSKFPQFNKPLRDANGPINVYGVPWIIGAKKGLPNFNQLSLVTAAQVSRKLEVTRSSRDPGSAVYRTNQMYVIGISNNLGISFWNSYNNNYPRPLTVYASDLVSMFLTNGFNPYLGYNTNFVYAATIPAWPGSQWSGTPPNAQPLQPAAFLNLNWAFNFLRPSVYRFGSATFDPVGSPTSGQFETTIPALQPLPQFGVLVTNYVQAYILDGNNVIDYVQLRAPLSLWSLNSALADNPYPDGTGTRLQWSTNYVTTGMPPTWGALNQLVVSGNPNLAPAMQGGSPWSTAPTPMGITTPQAEAANFMGFFKPAFQYGGLSYINNQLIQQAPYTPSRTAYASFLLQANDPLVHYLATDLNAQTGTWAYWANKQKLQNGDYYHSDDPINQPMPVAPTSPIGGRYQPWLQPGQMNGLAGVLAVTNNYAIKDPLVKFSDNWDFPTNLYPTVGWIGRVHRGTPWQTVYLKDADMTKYPNAAGFDFGMGTNTWAQWTGDIQQDFFGRFYDAANTAPVQDRLLFDLFTARLNDNAARGTLPVNQTHLAAWSALFSGLVVLSNNSPRAVSTTPLSYTNQIINPAGVVDGALPYLLQPPVWQIVNGPFGINATRTNTSLFPFQAFLHAGDILATPALTKFSPFLHLGTMIPGEQQMNYGLNDEEYEWLPQQIMGLVRATEPRYVVYAYGQTLQPAPGGEVLNGPFFQLITNYQVVAESAVRAVIRMDPHVTTNRFGFPIGTNYTAVVESQNELPPN